MREAPDAAPTPREAPGSARTVRDTISLVHMTPVASRPEDAQRTYERELRVAVQLLGRRIRSERVEDGLSEPEFAVLMHLDLDGETTAGSLARRERVSPSLMTRTLNQLEEQGYVTRQRSESDARCVVVSISALGRVRIQETRDRRNAWVAQELATLDADETAILKAAAPILRRLAGA